jgi:hypothetical protein
MKIPINKHMVIDAIKNIWPSRDKCIRLWVLLFIFLAGIALAFYITACSSINKKVGLRDDNIIEEGVEHVIQHDTGLDLDLTPGSSEQK